MCLQAMPMAKLSWRVDSFCIRVFDKQALAEVLEAPMH